MEDSFSKYWLVKSSSGFRSCVSPLQFSQLGNIETNVRSIESEGDLKAIDIVANDEDRVDRLIDTFEHCQEIYEWQFVLHADTKCSIGREIGIRALIFISWVTIVACEVGVGWLLANWCKGCCDREGALEACRLVDPPTSRLSNYNSLVMKQE